MAFSMDVDQLDKEKVVEELQPEPQVKEQLETMAEENAKEVMDIDLDLSLIHI